MLAAMPYRRGQFWIRRFQRQAESLCAALAAPTHPWLGFFSRARFGLTMEGFLQIINQMVKCYAALRTAQLRLKRR